MTSVYYISQIAEKWKSESEPGFDLWKKRDCGQKTVWIREVEPPPHQGTERITTLYQQE